MGPGKLETEGKTRKQTLGLLVIGVVHPDLSWLIMMNIMIINMGLSENVVYPIVPNT